MKTFTKLKFVLALFLFIGIQKVNAQCNPSFTFTYNANGNVSFLSTSTPTNASCWWTLGNNQTSTLQACNTTYTANGTYTVTLFIWSAAPSCSSSIQQTINITTAVTPTCLLNASFTHTVGTGNSVGFTSTSTNTNAGSTYTWYYGDSNIGSGSTSNHIYPGPGGYTAILVVNNGGGCIDSVGQFVNIVAPCTLSANFSTTQMSNGNVNFLSTSTGTASNSTYIWKRNNTTFASGSPAASNNFVNGTYTITLIVSNLSFSPACSSTISQVITVTSNTCNLSASFSSTNGAAGSVNYASTSTGTNANMTYFWDFGDGNNAGGNPTAHTYSNAGIYYTSLFVQDPNNLSCYDSVVSQVNITNIPCVANSNFSLTQLSPGFWNATPSYPWNVVSATWSWGDNTTSNQLYTSHTYSPIGVYNICLTVSVSCGATSSTCVTYTITRTSQPMSMAYVNVVMPQSTSVGIKTNFMSAAEGKIIIYPNPSNGEFELKLNGLKDEENAKVQIFNMTGSLVYETNASIYNGSLNKDIKLSNENDGVYFVKVGLKSGVVTKKIIVKH